VLVRALVLSALVVVTTACSQAAQNDARTAATAVAGLSATAQPVASEIARRIGNLDPADVGRRIGTVMGSNVEITLEPSDVPNADVTHAVVHGTDRTGAFGRLDVQARQSFASAGLQLARQSYPNALIDLTIVDGAGSSLVAVTYPPNGPPVFQ